MKRNVKYIGEAVAVALLAAGAPIVIPMIAPSTITQAADLEDKAGELNLTSDTSGLTVSTGTSLNDSKLQSGNSSLSIADDYSNDSSNSSVVKAMEIPIYGQSLYTTKEAAMSAAGSDNFDPAATNLGNVQNQLNNGIITTAGSYYQTISYKLSNDSAANSILNGEYNTYVDGKQGTNGTDFVLNKAAGTITIVRQFTVEGGISTNLESVKTVDINSSTDIDTTNYALFDGSKVISNSLMSDNNYYTDSTLETPATSDEIANGKFLKSGKYYHEISFTLASGDVSKDTLPTGLTAQGNTVTAIQEIDVNGTVNQGIQEPNVTVGESVSSNNDTDGNTLTNSNGSLVDTTKGDYKGVSFGSSYYKEGTSDADVLNNNVDSDTDVVDSNGNFAKTGTYLRTITFNLIDNSVDTDTFGIKEGSDYKLDTQNNTVTYVQKVHIGPEPTFAVPAAISAILPDQSVLTQADTEEKNSAVFTINDEAPTIGISLTDINSSDSVTINGVDSTNITYGNFYSTSEAALTGDSSYEVFQGQTEFNTGGTYYRTITFNLKDADEYNICYEVLDDEGKTTLKSYIKDKDYKIGKDNDSVTFAKKYVVRTTKVTMPDISVSVTKGESVSNIAKLPGFTYPDPTNPNKVTLSGIYNVDGSTKNRNYIYSTNAEYYDDINDASTRTNAISNDELIGKDSDGNDIFQTIGTYYRVITFSLTGIGNKWELADSNGSQDGMVSQDKNTYTTYYVVQPIIVTSENEVLGKIASPSTEIGASVTEEQNAETNDVISKYGNGDSILDSSRKIQFGTDYYPTTTRVKDILAGTATKSDDTVVSDDGTYALAGTCYRTVTIPITDDSTYEYDLTSSKLSDDRKSLTYVQTVTIGKKTSGTVGGIDTDEPIKVNANGDNKDLSSTNNYTLADGNESLIDTTNDKPGVSFSDDYYTDATATTKVDPSIAQKYTITKPGDYYRKVIFNVSPETLANYDFSGSGGIADTEANTVTFMQKVEVTAANSSSGSSSSSDDNNDDEWTYYQDAGVVTTKSDRSVYNLNNQDNDSISNRALAKNTSWVTDQYRTNRAGVKQYRVATGEWIDANDVNFQEQADNTTDDWIYYQDPGVVRTIIGQNYYSLNNQANETISNRALAKESSWVTDQYRTNRVGVKEYRVATGEWIDSHDVTFIKDIKNIVNVDETSSYYKLYDIDREVNGSRALEKKTSWQADKKAVDPDGNVYYRVATNEWVKQVKGVYLDTYAWY